MATSTSSSPAGDRAPLSRERVLEAGVVLADELGLGGLSMRKLATHLGFEVMSLYNHVANKRDLLEGMLDLIQAEVPLPDPATVDWKRGLRAVAVAQRDLLLRHRWAGPVSTDHFPGPRRWQLAECILSLLAAGGFDGHLRDLGYHAITLHIGGFTAQQIAYESDEDLDAEAFARVDRELRADVHPLMAEHIRYHREAEHAPGGRPDEFVFVLDLILDGLERTRDS